MHLINMYMAMANEIDNMNIITSILAIHYIASNYMCTYTYVDTNAISVYSIYTLFDSYIL